MAVPADQHRIACDLDRLLGERGMTLTELADRVGVTLVNLSVLKNGRAKAVRFSTLTAICDVLDCTPGDVLTVLPSNGESRGEPSFQSEGSGGGC